jgi:hypothetical protein
MTVMFEFDYQRDWLGEVRNDPEDGNAYVLRSVYRDNDQIFVNINDLFGGHTCSIPIDEWLEWEREEE